VPGHAHYLTFSCWRGQRLLGADRSRQWVLAALDTARSVHGFDLWTAKELHEKIAYIHNNPVRRGLIQRPEDWPWSSCRAWQTGIDEPLRIDRETLPPIER